MEISELLAQMVEYNASDLYLTTDAPPIWRTDVMIKGPQQPFTEEDIRGMMANLVSLDEIQEFEANKELNIAYVDRNDNRFRINFFRQRKRSGMVVRYIRKNIPSFEQLGLPDVYKQAIMHKNGLVLVTGPSGSGKSTSIAAMLDHLNNRGTGHVISVEDPIEFIHAHKGCLFTQREIGIDTKSWDEALKNALRQRPDVIYIGEIRDAETMLHAMTYAETGHLCIATIHSTSASQGIERVASFFSANMRQQHLYSLAHTLKYIFAQRLVNGATRKHEIAIEILKNEGLMKPLIMKGSIGEIAELIYKNADIGMCTFEQSLLKLYETGKITRATAIEESDNPQNMELELMRRGNFAPPPSQNTATKFSVDL